MSENFGQVVVVDFEYEIDDGELPNVLCMVAYVLDENLQHVRTIQLWRGEFGSTPPFDIGPDALFVAYSAWAEMTCFMVLGWKFPGAHLRPAHRLPRGQQRPAAVQSGRGAEEAERKRLVRRLPRLRHRRLGAHRQGATIAKAIGEGRWREYGREAVFDYCEEDVRMSVELLRAQLRGCDRAANLLPAADVERVLHWSNYSAKAVAQIQARGMPIDMPLWNLVQENKRAVIGELLRQFDPSHGSDDPIYTPDGEWSYARFEQWLVDAGVHGVAAPRERAARHRRRRLPLMYHVPGDRRAARAARQSRRHRRARLPIGPRRSQSAEAVSVRHRDRPQRARQEPRTTRTPACARSWCFRPTRSGATSIGERKRSALPRPRPAMPR